MFGIFWQFNFCWIYVPNCSNVKYCKLIRQVSFEFRITFLNVCLDFVRTNSNSGTTFDQGRKLLASNNDLEQLSTKGSLRRRHPCHRRGHHHRRREISLYLVWLLTIIILCGKMTLTSFNQSLSLCSHRRQHRPYHHRRREISLYLVH